MNQHQPPEQLTYGEKRKMSNNNLVDKITELSQKITELEQLIYKLCETFASWTDQLVEESNQPRQPDKKPSTYIS